MKRSIIALAVSVSLVSVDAMALPAAHSYGISQFGGSGECGDTSMTHDIHDQTAAEFLVPFQDRVAVNAWGSANRMSTQYSGAAKFVDALKRSYGADTGTNGDDTGAVAFIHTHGTHNTSSSTLTSGNDNDSCSISTSDMVLGNGSGTLEIAIAKACQGADFNVWQSHGYSNMTTSSSVFSMYNSFHGSSSCGTGTVLYVGDYAQNSFWSGVGENWLDEAYSSGAIFGVGPDDCPTSIVWGDSETSRANMYHNGGFKDRQLTNAPKTHSNMFFVGGCTPVHGNPLPDLN